MIPDSLTLYFGWFLSLCMVILTIPVAKYYAGVGSIWKVLRTMKEADNPKSLRVLLSIHLVLQIVLIFFDLIFYYLIMNADNLFELGLSSYELGSLFISFYYYVILPFVIESSRAILRYYGKSDDTSYYRLLGYYYSISIVSNIFVVYLDVDKKDFLVAGLPIALAIFKCIDTFSKSHETAKKDSEETEPSRQ